ncbi:MAG: hypothetical protein OXB84_01820 [Halobacteriovoraceae bacterium]|nr:hypothetical protein [Halobacteriovoraceae bacterium]
MCALCRLVPVFLIFLTACSGNIDDINDISGLNTSEFSSGIIRVEKVQSMKQESLWMDVTGRDEVTFKVCLKERGHLTPLTGELFGVENKEGKRDTTADVNGCILFNRIIEYPKAISEQVLFKFGVTITAKGNYRGYKVLTLAYNPWTQQVKDLRRGKEEIDSSFIVVDLDNIEVFEDQIKNLLTPVIARNMQLAKNTYLRTRQESEFIYDVYLKVEFRKMGAHSFKYTPLSSGEFTGDFFWMQRDEQSGVITHTFGKHSLPGKIDESGNLVFKKLPLQFAGRNQNVPFELGLILRPQNAGAYTFRPNYMNGKVDNLLNPSIVNLELGDKSRQLLQEYELKKNITYQYGPKTLTRHPFIVSEITARVLPYSGDHAYQLRKLYSFIACIKNPDFLIPTPVFDKEFTISSGGVNFSKTSHTRLEGCLVWEHLIDYSRTDRSRTLILPVEIIGGDEFSGTFKTNLLFNPWDENKILDQRMLFEEDMKNLASASSFFSKKTPSQIMQENKNKENPTKLFIKSVDMRYRGSNRLPEKAIFRYDVAIGNPQIKRQGIQNPLTENLYQGAFRANFYLVERSTETEEITRVFNHFSILGEINDNRELLFQNVSLELDRARNKARELDLIIDIVPVATEQHPLPENFAPVSGYVRLTEELMNTSSLLFHPTSIDKLSGK